MMPKFHRAKFGLALAGMVFGVELPVLF